MINFSSSEGNFFVEGVTDKGARIYFVQLSEKQSKPNNVVNGISPIPSEIVIYSNIYITERMIEVLDSFNVITVKKLCNLNSQIIAYPMPDFSYTKLKIALSEFVDIFEL